MVAIFISYKSDFKLKMVKGNEEGHYIMIKGSIQQEDITIVNIYAPKIRVHKYIKQILTELKGEINSNTVIAGDFNTPF